MRGLAIYLLILLSSVNSNPLYTLYNRLIQHQNPLLMNLGPYEIVLPEQSQLIISIRQAGSPYKYFTFLQVKDQKIKQLYKDNRQRYFPDDYQILNSFWVDNQYLLLIGNNWKFFYRPPLASYTRNFSYISENFTIKAGFVRKNKNGITQLSTISNINGQLLLRKQSLTFGSSILVQIIPLYTLKSKQNFKKLFNLKDFQCVLSSASKGYTYIFSCYHLNSSKVYQHEFRQKFSLKNFAFDKTTNTIYCVGSELVGYELYLRNNSLQIDRKYLHNDTQDVDQICIDKDQIILYVVQEYFSKAYLRIISIKNPEKPFQFQLYRPLQPDEEYYSVMTRQKEIYIIPYYKQNNWFLLFRTHDQLPLFFILATFAFYAMLILTITFKSATNYLIYHQIVKIEQRLKITFFQLTITLIVLPAAALLQVLSTDTTKSTNFIPSHTRLVSLESYILKIFNMLFFFTFLISTVCQTYAQYKSKSRYLNGLIKHGLSLEGYFFVKQHFIVIKSLFYSIFSTSFMVFLDSNYSSEQLQLYPTTVQLLAVSVAYFACFFTAYNTNLFLMYYFKNYWMSMCVTLSMTFLIAFSNGQFYLNNVVSIQQLCFVAISPQALFSAITQHIFKTAVRFNEEITAYFLFEMLFAQTIGILIIYSIFISQSYKEVKFSSLTHKNQGNSNNVINKSQQMASEKSIQSSLICNSVASNPLLEVFIPSKLSKNEGFQKTNLLKNILFTANKGEVVTFVDNVNLSKAMLFKILVNDQESDSHVEKDLLGSVSFKQKVRISYCFEYQHCFEELTVYQHVKLFSILKDPKMSRSERKSKIEFMLNQFNFPDEFRIMKPRELSGGYLKKMCLACTFIGEPDVVIIDEPSLGLDNRIRGMLYQKLREWKQNKLIIVGTSDNSQAENISDKIWTLRKSKIVDYNSEKQKRFITFVNLHFFEENDLSQTEKLVNDIFKDIEARFTASFNQMRKKYLLRIQIFQRQDHAYYNSLNKLMFILNQSFGLTSDKCLIDLSIVEHPYNESVLSSLRTMKDQMVSLKEMDYYMKNNAVDVSSEQEQLLEMRQRNNNINVKAIRLLDSLSQIDKKKYLLFSQFQAIIYKQYKLWKNNSLYLQTLLASAYSWVQYLLWYKVNRQVQYYDFANMLIIYCFLHTSIFSKKENQFSSNKKSKTYLIGGNPLIEILANRAFGFLYLFISFASNIILQKLIISFVITGEDIDSDIFEKLLSGCLYVLNYTLYAALLSRIVSRVDFIVALILLTNVVLIWMNFNSFIISYNTYYFSIFQVIKDFYFPLATTYFLLDKEVSPYLLYMSASALFMLIILLTSEQLSLKRFVQNQRIPNHENIHNEPIDNERVFIENLENRSQVPLICQNIIHKYSKEVVVKNFSCHINKGEIFGLLGHNGCGKTTVFNIVAGLVSQSSGIVEQFGQEKGQIGYLEKLNRGYCPQSGSLEEEMTVEQNIRFVGMIKGLTSNYITKFMLLFLKYFRLKGIEQVKVKYLSQAEKKKIAFIIAFLGFPKLMYFDEITSGVEQESRKRMLELMRSYSDEYNASIFFSTHNIHEAESYCDRVSIMKDGVMKNAGEPMKLRMSKHHEFYLLQMSFIKSEEGLIVEKKKSKVKQYIYSLTFVRIEFEGNFRLIYNLDMLKVDILSVWNRIFLEFYKKGIIDKFTLKRHSLEQVVKQSLNQQQHRDTLISQSKLD